MDSSSHPQPTVLRAAHGFWTDAASRVGPLAATRGLLAALWEFLCDSTPSRLRSRYGDADYDWDHHVNTTSGAVGWRDRLLGAFHSAYQPTDPASFREMLASLAEHTHLNFPDFTFLDLGSGKGRTLLMASEYPFRHILGVELLPTLHQIAQQNLCDYTNDSQQCFALESVCADATQFRLPAEPLVIYLFNPFGESALRRVVANLEQSWRANPRPLYVLYYNPLLEHLLTESSILHKLAGGDQYSIFGGRASL
jgi:SAM-dependent methyltransferase